MEKQQPDPTTTQTAVVNVRRNTICDKMRTLLFVLLVLICLVILCLLTPHARGQCRDYDATCEEECNERSVCVTRCAAKRRNEECACEETTPSDGDRRRCERDVRGTDHVGSNNGK